ncbi:MAG: nucleotidyltransferase domain-containing protein [Bacteroidales bacterium]
MNKSDYIKNQILAVIDRTYPDSEVYLFGSRARGDFKKTSDWDLLILMNFRTIPFEVEKKFVDEFYDLELQTGEVFSPLVYSKNEWDDKYLITPLHEVIDKEGIKLK